ncbi:ferrochelatase [Exilibacterium tricleocarpae]|uniref:Ferrochelatase n=1 Tax=Exilibacterium tricleocarpae TaxID=2591008 RepID=A0A545T5W6_9GAMM|nr:ferrochelatase [Exilibacterium tricleocarpae]TQV72626.1 ferrochelatase [Exilibacterium tricleocarpae]
MARYSALSDKNHDQLHSKLKQNATRTGILITNLGTPDAPTPAALRRYLAEFLADPRVVEIPRLLWLCILHGIILRIRPRKSAALYRQIWWEKGSPLLVISSRQREKLQQQLGDAAVVKLGMRYGNPAIATALREFQAEGIDRVVVLPLYPQYGGPTTGATFDAVAGELRRWRRVPQLHFINSYFDSPAYIDALGKSIATYIDSHGMPDRLLLSYHGMPKQFLLSGDPYYCHSLKTTRLLREQLGLDEDRVITCFQSRFGKAEWLQPYTDKTLETLAQDGVKSVAIACPAFSVDCLETLEEIAIQNREIFLDAGGSRYDYIPALNDGDDHIAALAALVKPFLPSHHA